MKRILSLIVLSLGAAAVAAVAPPRLAREPATFIVQGADLAAVSIAVAGVGGEITHRLGIIDAVAARLTAGQIRHLHGLADVRRLWADHTLEIARGTPQPDTVYPSFIDADLLHDADILGTGVTVAVLDTGTWEGGWIRPSTRTRSSAG